MPFVQLQPTKSREAQHLDFIGEEKTWIKNKGVFNNSIIHLFINFGKILTNTFNIIILMSFFVFCHFSFSDIDSASWFDAKALASSNVGASIINENA